MNISPAGVDVSAERALHVVNDLKLMQACRQKYAALRECLGRQCKASFGSSNVGRWRF